MRRVKPLLDRFNEKWIGEPNSGCWLWTAHVTPEGYGTIRLGRATEGSEFAHRVSWLLHNGTHPGSSLVCHQCDNPSCVNPDHLFLGTYSDNTVDAMRKGRFIVRPFRRDEITSIKLTEEMVRNIRLDGESSRKVAAKYGVSHTVILYIRRGTTWSHVQ